jgi:succinate dehydrogenase flavin-adding protein (antitoxin of CptAB toxin-antitoxin module)
MLWEEAGHLLISLFIQKEEPALTDEECLSTYNQLITILDEEGMSWLADQVEDQIHQGKVRQVENVETVKVRKEDKQPSLFGVKDPTATQFESGRRASFLVVSDYTPREQLLLLIDAIMINALARLNVEESTLTFLQHQIQANSLILYSDQEDREVATFHLDDLPARREQRDLLIETLKQLQAEVSNEHA